MSRPPSPLPGPLALVLALTRAALGETAPVAAPAASDWPLFLDLVERHRLGAFLAHNAHARIAEICPPAVARQLRASLASTTQRALAVMAHQVRLTRLLGGAGIETLAVKGLVSAEQFYGGIGRRYVGDLDLLVRPSDVPRADALLLSVPGMTRTRPHFALTPRQLKAYVRVKPEFEYTFPLAGLRVELLWWLEGLPVGEEIWNDTVECAPGGQRTRTLARELNGLYLFQHGARHAWFRLFWLVDIALLLRSPDFNPEKLIALARRLGAERAVLQGAALAHELLGSTLPPSLQPRPRERGAIRALVDEARRQIIRTPSTHENVAEWCRQTAYRVRLQTALRARLAVLTPHLFSPLNWHTLPLPDRWFFLYYPATPFLWAWRRLTRKPDTL